LSTSIPSATTAGSSTPWTSESKILLSPTPFVRRCCLFWACCCLFWASLLPFFGRCCCLFSLAKSAHKATKKNYYCISKPTHLHTYPPTTIPTDLRKIPPPLSRRITAQ
jgi:hypothetical protein